MPFVHRSPTPNFMGSFLGQLIGLMIVLCLGSCSTCAGQDSTDSASEHRFYENHIRPLLVKHCYQCHSEKAGKQESNLLLDRRKGWLEGGDSGPSVVPGDVDASILIRAVRYKDPSLQMPPTRRLSDDEVAKLERWVGTGAKAPDDFVTKPSDNPSDPVVGKEHWAFQPLHASSVPVANDAWENNPVDAFVSSQLAAHGLKRGEPAPRHILARRVYVQLIGIPPTTDQLQQFLSDDSEAAFERLVDELLSSPRFGERWGRHWLDLARYADSNGLDENFLFREAWRYRNWVIEAVNQDLPYDRFVLMQLAGDLLPHTSVHERDRQRIAAGFLLIGPKVLLGNDERNQRMEIADEQIDTIGRAMLGQTLGCARCHDHKFDPIPTADYYALAGIFASTRVMERRHMLGEQRVMERLVGLNEANNATDDAYEEYWRNNAKVRATKKQADKLLELLKKNNDEEFSKAIEGETGAVADEAKVLTHPLEQRIAAQQALVAKLAKTIAEAPAIPPRAMIPVDVDEPADENIRIAGQFDRLGDKIPRGFLTVLSDSTLETISPKESGRLALSQWLTDRNSRSGQLAARVLANRVWHHLIGRGIVRTVDNFGRTGEPPTHTELLDYLAMELIDSGWSVKHLVREIVLSQTFQLSSQYEPSNHAVDPENRFLWRAHRRKMDPESFRDGLLSTADNLDVSWVNSTVSYLGDQATAVGQNKVRRRTDFACRSVYLPVIRNDLPELFDILDFANPHTTTGMRPNTTVPAQGLFMLNDEMIMENAKATAKRIMEMSPTGDVGARIDRMFKMIVGTGPSEAQHRSIELFLENMQRKLRTEGTDAQGDVDQRALELACHALFVSSRFQYLD
ncbi:MAG: PSD1 and planctomycete cytochrome C domain-containing protein [Pirellula sp.]